MAMDRLARMQHEPKVRTFRTSGHITSTSRGCNVGSSSNNRSRHSRSTSTCRAGPWQSVDLNCPIRSAATLGARSAMTSALTVARRDFGAGWFGKMHRLELGGTEADLKFTNVASKTRQQRIWQISALTRLPNVGSWLSLRGCMRELILVHSAGLGCGSQMCTSRFALRALKINSLIDRQPGRSEDRTGVPVGRPRPGPSTSARLTCPSRSAGPGTSILSATMHHRTCLPFEILRQRQSVSVGQPPGGPVDQHLRALRGISCGRVR